jgi:threonine/homoserine/homoserine lactone efflux protein
MSAIIVGIIAGFLVSAGVGPINIMAMSKSVRESFLHGLMIGIGAAIMDMVYAGIASLGLSSIFDYQIVKLIFQFLGIPLLFYLGIKSFHYIPPKVNVNTNNFKNVKYHNSILIGMSLYLANPTFLPLWVGIVGIIHSRMLMENTFADNIIFAVGVLLGTIAWFYVLLKFFLRWQIFSHPKTIRRISHISGILLLGFGVYMGYKLVLDIINQSDYLKGIFF